MKASELMIGDWVNWNTYTDRPDFRKITQISYDTRIEGSDVFNCEPIPLDEEILYANGWFYNYLYKIWVFGDEDKMDFAVKIDNIAGMSVSLYKDYPIIFIKNVHELQHALRLVGLNEMADNFKL